jgi:CheY-like chemotaxis protein
MVRVTESEDPEAQVVLIVDNNPMNTMRLTQVFTQMGWKSEVCEDGDIAVDTYVEVKPDLVLLALDLPTMDGHTAALEMRESDSHARITFMSSRSQRKLAADATHSAGAVAWLEKPVTKQIIDDNWEMIMGEIPEAPGLEDLDNLYPDVDVERAKRDGEEIVEVVSALPPLPELPAIPVPVPVATTPSKPKKKGKKLKRLLILIILASAGAGIAWQQGLI